MRHLGRAGHASRAPARFDPGAGHLRHRMPGAQFAFFTSTYACTICVYENLRTLRASASIRLRKLEIPNSNRNSTAWVKIAKPTKCTTSMKPFVSIALVTRWPELSYKRESRGENTLRPLHYYVWLVNNECLISFTRRCHFSRQLKCCRLLRGPRNNQS